MVQPRHMFSRVTLSCLYTPSLTISTTKVMTVVELVTHMKDDTYESKKCLYSYATGRITIRIEGRPQSSPGIKPEVGK